MSRGSRFRTLLITFGTLVAAGPAGAETKAAGQWTDPPAKVTTPATNAAVPKPAATPARIDEPPVAARPEARPPRRSAKLRRAGIRTVASRARPVRQARAEVSRRAERPSRRITVRTAAPLRMTSGPMRGLRPVYGFIPPDAPADAYYQQRRFGTAGNRPGDLGLPPPGGLAYRTVGMRQDGRLIVRWGGAPPDPAPGRASPFEAFEAE